MHSDSDGSTPMFEGSSLIGGRYRLLEKIGEGGAAEVFRARDQRLDRTVAVKLLRPQFTYDQASRTRFVNEAKAAAGLSHPNIVDIYDFGEGPDHSMFIAMQYVEGQNLKDILQKRGRMSAAEAVSIGQGVCYALDAAHAKGLIHRDVKPQNIMIDRAGNVRLTDFGIVKALSGPALTQSGMTFGTAAYLSPEQATGEPISPASDIYALGCVLYELLSGTPPFTGENPAVVAYKQVWEQPRPLHDLVPEVPPSLESVVMRCLNKDPARRYPTADALASDLATFQNSFNQPTQAVSLGLGAIASVRANAGEWVPVTSRAPAELSQAIQMPAVPAGYGEAEYSAVDVPAARPRDFISAPVPQAAAPSQPYPQAVAAYNAEPVRTIQVVNAGRRRGGLGWVPLALAGVLAIAVFALLASQGKSLFGGAARADATSTPPSPTLGVVVEAPSASPTLRLGGVIVGSPTPPAAVPLSTNTPAPPPTLTNTPIPPTEAPPTDTPAPVPTDTAAPALPTDTSVPEVVPTTPPATATPPPPPPTDTVEVVSDTPVVQGNGTATILLDDTRFSGGFTNNGGTYHGLTAHWVYGQGTKYSTMTVTFNVGQMPGAAALTVRGVDSEDAKKTQIRISLNGNVLYQGADPLPNDNANGPNRPGNWGLYVWQIPVGQLQQGANTLSITNLDQSSCINCPDFFMLDAAFITYRTQ